MKKSDFVKVHVYEIDYKKVKYAMGMVFRLEPMDVLRFNNYFTDEGKTLLTKEFWDKNVNEHNEIDLSWIE
jgi:hypothetical protein